MATSTEKARVTASSAADGGTRRKVVVKRSLKPSRIASIPDIAYAEGYVKRKLSIGLSDYIAFDYALANRVNVLIEGPTGSGKTSAVMAWAAERGYHFYSISSSIGLEPSQLFGKFIPDGENGIVWQDGPVTDIVRNGGVLLLNEVNFIPDRIGTVLFSLLDKRREIQLVDHRGEVVKAHYGAPDCWCEDEECSKAVLICADMNPDYSGTHPLNAAFRNRFSMQLIFEYDEKIEEKLVPYPALRTLATQIRDRVKTGEFETPVSTNMLVEFVRNYTFLGLDFALQNFRNHFNDDEREPLSKVLDTHKGNIEMALSSIERLTPYGEKAYNKRSGHYGTDWGYEDEGDEQATEELEEESSPDDPDFQFGDTNEED
jgi:hypothetical protein